MKQPTYDECVPLLAYDAESGEISWKVARGRCAAGTVAGCDSQRGYRIIRVLGSMIYAHRVAFLLMTGRMPDQVDHINGIRDDNRWSNLREVTLAENRKNQKTPVTNTSGRIGVVWLEDKRRWRATIKAGNKTTYLGNFHDFADADAARAAAEVSFGFHPNHGR